MRITHFGFLGAAVLVAACCLAGQSASAALIEDFDGGGSGVPYHLMSSSGTPASLIASGASGNMIRVANLDGSNNNSIAFDKSALASGPAPGGIRLAFDFRMSTDEDNNAAGGCCNSAADGLGIGLFATSVYGETGPANPPVMGQGEFPWERPSYNSALTVGLDVFERIDVISFNWNGAQVAEADVQSYLNLNDGVLHRAVVDVTPDGANAIANMWVLEDIHGNTAPHKIFDNLAVPGLNLATLPDYRLIAGGRTGGAFVAGDIDNIYVNAIPEPSSMMLLVLSGLGLLGLRRRG